MHSIFDLCEPRAEVLRGELKEDIFAARLKDVIDGNADPVYGDAKTFFDNTYPTAGLKTLLNDVISRLVGDSVGKNAIIRLETAFGGGKTHNLIALYHAASGHVPQQTIRELLGENADNPKPEAIKIAGLVGSDLDPTGGIFHPLDQISTYTLWGELAYQLGGINGYDESVKLSEQHKSAPGTGLLDRLIGEQPTLIMIDEIARHLRAAMAVPTATGHTTLADQTVAFLMSLLEFASSKQRCVVVLTLASESDAFAEETEFLRQKLTETLQVTARQERVLTPTAEGEIFSIVNHRLFKSVDKRAAEQTSQAYMQYYQHMLEKNADLPQRCTRAEYGEEIVAAYPFHPELLVTLNRKTATIPNFNQTRGALRLLAWTIRNLWEKQPSNTWMIHIHHLDLSHSQIVEDLTSRLDRPQYRQVIEADIISPLEGTKAHAEEIDISFLGSNRPHFARRLGTTIFLHSLTQGTASGVDPADLYLATMTPSEGSGGEDPAIMTKSLERLTNHAWFLEYDGHRYRFKTEPSINKIIADETSQVGTSKAKLEIENRIHQIWKKGYFKPVYFPVEAVDVEDDAGIPKLAILHFDHCQSTSTANTIPDEVRKIYEYSGTLESFRKYQNNVIFLIADKDQVENLVNVARRYLAIRRIVNDAERMSQFTKEQKEKLRNERDAAELDVRVAVTKAYRYLYYPSQDAPGTDSHLRRETLPAQDQGDVDKDQTNVILRVLRALKKLQTADDDLLSAFYVKSKAWDLNQTSMTTEELRKAFARKIGLRILLDIGQLKKTIKNGIEQKVWIYYDSQEELGYDHESPPTSWQISEDALLYTPEEATHLKIHVKGKWSPGGGGEVIPPSLICPVCGMPESQCICGIQTPIGIPKKLEASGGVNQAFQAIIDQCQEHHITHLKKVLIKIDGQGKQIATDMRALGLSIPQLGKGIFGIEQELTARFQLENEHEDFTVSFRGGWDRYKRLKTVTDAFGQEADEIRVTMRIAVEYEGGLEIAEEHYNTIREILSTLQIGKILLEAIPVTPEEGNSL